jgi:hypothetical protein
LFLEALSSMEVKIRRGELDPPAHESPDAPASQGQGAGGLLAFFGRFGWFNTPALVGGE